MLAPGCKADVEKGIDHVLLLRQSRRKEILKIHFGVTSGLSKMLLKDTEEELRKLMAASIESNDDGGCVGVTESATENANDALPSVPTFP